MPRTESSPHIPEVAVLAAAVGGAALLWFSRDVMSTDIALRLLLTAVWLILWTLATFGTGAPVVRRILRTNSIALVDLPVVLLTGAGILATLATILALTGFFHEPVLITILLVAMAVGLRESLKRHIDPANVARSIPAVGWIVIVVTASLLPVLAAPPVMYDALNYHLAFPDHWLAAGHFVEFPRHGFSYYPSSYGMLYSYGLAAVGPWSASAIHFWFGALATLTAAGLGLRLGGPKTAAWAAACFGLTPAVLEVSTYATADLAVAAWSGAAFSALCLVSGGRPSGRQLVLSGFLLGCTLAAKYLAIAIVLLPLVAVVAVLIATYRAALTFRIFGGAAIATSLPLLPWLVRNTLWTGNPLYPYLQGLLGGSPSDMSVGVHMAQIGGTDPGTLAWFLQSISALGLRTLEPLGQGGLLGPHWLLLLPVAALIGRGAGDRTLKRSLWVFTITGLLAWGGLIQMTRFLLPVLVVAAPLAGWGAAALVSSNKGAVRWSFRLLLGFILVWNATMIATTQNLDRMGVAAGLTDAEDDYMRRWISYYPAIQFLNEELPPDSRVLFVGEPRSFYIDPQVVIEDPFRTPLLVELAASGLSANDIVLGLGDLGVTHLLVNTHEMPLAAKLRGVDDYWAGTSPAQRAVLEEFLNQRLTRLAGDSALWVARLNPGNEAATPPSSP